MSAPADRDVHAAEHALRAAGLRPSGDETRRLAAGYGTLRAKADALAALDLRDDPPVDPAALTPAPAPPPGEGGRPR